MLFSDHRNLTIIIQKSETGQPVNNLLKAWNRLIISDFQIPRMSISYHSKKKKINQLKLNLDCNVEVFFSEEAVKLSEIGDSSRRAEPWFLQSILGGNISDLSHPSKRGESLRWPYFGNCIDEDLSSPWDEIAMFSSSKDSEATSFWGGIKQVAFFF